MHGVKFTHCMLAPVMLSSATLLLYHPSGLSQYGIIATFKNVLWSL